MTLVNLNDRVKFKLTEAGRKAMQARHDNAKTYMKNLPEKTFAVGQEVSMPLWDVIQLFGETTGLGLETFCQGASIELCKCEKPAGYVMPNEPESYDGHDYEGFPGGCSRMGCGMTNDKDTK